MRKSIDIKDEEKILRNKRIFLIIFDIILLPLLLYESIYLFSLKNIYAIFTIISVVIIIFSFFLIYKKKDELTTTINIGVLNLIIQFGLLFLVSHSTFIRFQKSDYLFLSIFLSSTMILFLGVFGIKFYQYILFAIISFLFTGIIFVFNIKEFLNNNIIIAAFVVYIIFVILSYFIFKLNRSIENLYKEKDFISRAYYNKSEFLRVLLDTISNPIYYKDDKLKYIGCNKAFIEYLGKKEEDIIGKSVFDIINREMAEFYNQKDIELLNGEEKLQIHEDVVWTKDGELKNIILNKVKFYIDNRPYIIGVATDITELKKAKEEALCASRAKSEFLAKITHEIRNPLNAINGFIECLKFTDITDEQREYLNYIEEASKLLLEMVNDILDFSKIEVNKLELKYEIIDLKKFLDEVIHLVKVSAEKKSLKFITTIKENLPLFIEVDSLRLKQVLINLLSNAVKFTEKGKVEFSLTFKESYQKNYGFFTFSINDTGIGIKEEDEEKLFKAFNQIDNTLTRKFSGTGLGLVISSAIVEKMGGNIEFESKYGEGSTFYFTLKLHYRS